MEWKKCNNHECTNGKEGGVAYIDASKPYSKCFKCNQASKQTTIPMETVEDQELSPIEHGLIFKKAIDCLLDQGKLQEGDEMFHIIYKQLKKWHLASRPK